MLYKMWGASENKVLGQANVYAKVEKDTKSNIKKILYQKQ